MEYNILELSVYFPFEAYPSQLKFMEKVVGSLKGVSVTFLKFPIGFNKFNEINFNFCQKKSRAKMRCSNLQLGLERPCVCSVRVFRGESCVVSNLCRIEIFFRQKSYKALYQMSNHMSQAETEAPTSAGNSVKSLMSSIYANSKLEDLVNQPLPKIYYASRTHSQLSQVVKELRNTVFKDLRVCVLGSRDQMCIEDSVKSIPNSSARTAACKKLVDRRSCKFHSNVASSSGHPIMDIEELVKFGQHTQTCPYYLSREDLKSADIVFLPYNYLVDPNSRASQNIVVQNSIVIFDEAHNLEGSCNEASSFELTPSDLSICLEELKHCVGNFDTFSERHSIKRNDIELLIQISAKLRKILEDFNVGNNNSNGITRPGDFIIEIIESAGVSFDNVEKLIEIAITIASSNTSTSKLSDNGRFRSGLSHLVQCLRIVFSADHINNPHELRMSYKVHIHKSNNSRVKTPDENVLSFWCFSSGVAMKGLKKEGCRSIILASGTLAPLESFATELQLPFANSLENPHVIQSNQLFASVIPRGPAGFSLNSSYKRRNDPRYLADLGNVIASASSIIPDGILVFFPSYQVMDSCIRHWKQSISHRSTRTIFQEIESKKRTFIEPKDKSDFGLAMDEFYHRINDQSSKGAIFFAVCRGKASEGIDFSDSKGRAVIITGIPYPSINDPRVQMKKVYLDDLSRYHREKNTGVVSVSGNVWYQQQGSRAVNQAIGRVIRHKNDWGAILLCDERFGEAGYRNQLPKWISQHLKVYPNFDESMSKVKEFVALNNKSPDQPKKNPVHQQNFPVNSNSGFILNSDNQNQSKARSSNSLEKPSKRSVSLKNLASKNTKKPKVSHLEMEITAKRYLEQLKTNLERPDYKRFQRYLKDWKKSVISTNDALSGLEELFATPKLVHFFREFEPFIASSDKQRFYQRAEHLENKVLNQENSAPKKTGK